VKEWFLSNPHFGQTPQDRYDLLFEGGLKIVTTVDLRLQHAAERAIGSVLTEPGDPYGALTGDRPRGPGYVRAMVGGRDYWSEDDDFARINLATGGVTGRQAGSAFKPFALVAALEHGIPRRSRSTAPPRTSCCRTGRTGTRTTPRAVATGRSRWRAPR
jgi:membrane peptidoglycan carboxypeptidase